MELRMGSGAGLTVIPLEKGQIKRKKKTEKRIDQRMRGRKKNNMFLIKKNTSHNTNFYLNFKEFLGHLQ